MTTPFGVEEVNATLETVFVTVENITETVVIEAGPLVSATVPPRQEVTDLISSVEAYIGYAAPGTLTSAPSWQICRVVDTADGPITSWARSGTGSLSNLVWDDRLSYAWP